MKNVQLSDNNMAKKKQQQKQQLKAYLLYYTLCMYVCMYVENYHRLVSDAKSQNETAQ